MKTYTDPEHPGYFATMVEDSINAYTRKRLSTIHIRIPWYITPELLKHRVFSINSRSTRATPVSVLLSQVENDLVFPADYGKNQRGMQPGEAVSYKTRKQAEIIIRGLAKASMLGVRGLSDLGLHKQVCNKYLIPYLWCDLLVSSTTWANALTLRTHTDAAKEMQIGFALIADALVDSDPKELMLDEWHLPYITEEEKRLWPELSPYSRNRKLGMVSAARCARISVKPFDSEVVNMERDLELAEELKTGVPVHATPFEHVAKASFSGMGEGNFGSNSGWVQLRSTLKDHTTKEFTWKGKVIL